MNRPLTAPAPTLDGGLTRHLFPDGHEGWLATGYDESRAVLGCPTVSQAVLQPLGGVDDRGYQEALSGPESVGDLLRNDPPQHSRVRQAVANYFTVRRVAERRPAVERIVDEQIHAMEEAGSPVDFVSTFAFAVPSRMICDILDVPFHYATRFNEAWDVVSDTGGTTPGQKKAAMEKFYVAAREIVADKRARPGDDLISDLALAGELTAEELSGIVFLLYVAGHHTTATMFAVSIQFLLSDRTRWQSAMDRLPEIAGTVEELLMHVNPVSTPLPRTAQEDLEVCGRVVRAGETVAIETPTPCGDPRMMGDDDSFVLGREVPPLHLAFGFGRHMCLGQHVARLELQIGLERLMRRFPNLSLVDSTEDGRIDRKTALHRQLLVAW